MSEWFYSLSAGWMTVLVFAATFLVTAVIYLTVKYFAVGDRTKAFMSVSGGMLPPLGVVYGLFVTIIASEVWGDVDKAKSAVTREASALSTVVFMVASFPGETEARIRDLISRHISEAINQEWPMMANHSATLKVTSLPLAEALQLVLAQTPQSEGQMAAQRAIVSALQDASDARRQRIIVSQSNVNWIKWACMIIQAMCTLTAIAMIHSGNRTASLSAMGIFATGVAVSILLIVSHNRPFGGVISVSPDQLAQVEPEDMLSQKISSHAIALRLTNLLHAARQVISDHQEIINQQTAEIRFTADKVIEEAKVNYLRTTGYPLAELDNTSAEGMMLKAELEAIKEVMDEAQPVLNDPNVGNKYFLPAIFTYRVAQHFSKKVGKMAYLKLTAPEDLIRHQSNMPDSWESQVIETKFRSPDWQKGRFVAEVAELNGKQAYRLMIPEYYQASCLACHVGSNDDENGKAPRQKLGELGGAISAAIFLK